MLASDVGYQTTKSKLVYCGVILNKSGERMYLYTTPEDYMVGNYLEARKILKSINKGAGIAGYKLRLPVIHYEGRFPPAYYESNNTIGAEPPKDELLLLYRNRHLIGGFKENGLYISGTVYGKEDDLEEEDHLDEEDDPDNEPDEDIWYRDFSDGDGDAYLESKHMTGQIRFVLAVPYIIYEPP